MWPDNWRGEPSLGFLFCFCPRKPFLSFWSDFWLCLEATWLLDRVISHFPKTSRDWNQKQTNTKFKWKREIGGKYKLWKSKWSSNSLKQDLKATWESLACWYQSPPFLFGCKSFGPPVCRLHCWVFGTRSQSLHIGLDASELFISGVFQVGSLRAHLGKVITSSCLCFNSPCLDWSPPPPL